MKNRQTDPFKPHFKGCVVLPLTDDDEDIKRIRYYGDWYDRKKQLRIMKRPRKYHLTFYFKGYDGERGVESVKILQKDDFLELSAYILQFGKNAVDEIGAEKIDLKNSYVSIRA